MKTTRHSALAALATAAIFASVQVHAQQAGNVPASPRPADPTANLPSDTGSQTTLPSGAVTGAGQPQGTVKQPRAGAPGGLEQRARSEARMRDDAAAGATGQTRGTAQTGATRGAGETRTPAAATPGAREGGAATGTRAPRRTRG